MSKRKKSAHSVSPADQISLYFPSLKIFCVFPPKGGRSVISQNVGRSVHVEISYSYDYVFDMSKIALSFFSTPSGLGPHPG